VIFPEKNLEDQMKVFVIIAALSVVMTGCVTNQEGGAVIGGVSGGVLGNTIGKGSTRTIATIGGTVIGTIAGAKVGESIDRQKQQSLQYRQVQVPLNSGVDGCSQFRNNQSAYASCQRGVQDRKAEEQRILEQQAYQAGRGR